MFKLDGPLMNFLNKATDIMILNVLIMVFSLPVFTAGASFSAAYYVGFKMIKNEESYIIKTFLRAFRENFKQATAIWLIILGVAGGLAADYRILYCSGIGFSKWLRTGTVMVTFFMLMAASYLFPLQARFINSVKNTIRNALLMAFSHLPASIAMLVLYAVPAVIYLLAPQLFPAILLLASGSVIYGKCVILSHVFRRYEEAWAEGGAEAEDGHGGSGLTESGENAMTEDGGRGGRDGRPAGAAADIGRNGE